MLAKIPAAHLFSKRGTVAISLDSSSCLPISDGGTSLCFLLLNCTPKRWHERLSADNDLADFADSHKLIGLENHPVSSLCVMDHVLVVLCYFALICFAEV